MWLVRKQAAVWRSLTGFSLVNQTLPALSLPDGYALRLSFQYR